MSNYFFCLSWKTKSLYGSSEMSGYTWTTAIVGSVLCNESQFSWSEPFAYSHYKHIIMNYFLENNKCFPKVFIGFWTSGSASLPAATHLLLPNRILSILVLEEVFHTGLNFYLRVPKDGYKISPSLIFLWGTAFGFLNLLNVIMSRCLKLLLKVAIENLYVWALQKRLSLAEIPWAAPAIETSWMKVEHLATCGSWELEVFGHPDRRGQEKVLHFSLQNFSHQIKWYFLS